MGRCSNRSVQRGTVSRPIQGSIPAGLFGSRTGKDRRVAAVGAILLFVVVADEGVSAGAVATSLNRTLDFPTFREACFAMSESLKLSSVCYANQKQSRPLNAHKTLTVHFFFLILA
jgi:hypothetical protein